MTFTGIPFWAVASIAVGAAGALAVLHLLRVRRRQVRVVTTMFWRQAAEESRARSLIERFRYPLTWAMLTLICALIALALGKPVMDAERGSPTVVVLDAGASMDVGTRMADARDAVRKHVAGSGRVAVIAAAPEPRLLLAFDESPAALADRLAAQNPAAGPSDTAAALRLARSLASGETKANILLVTDRPQPGVQDDVQVVTVGDPTANAAIVGAQFEPDAANPLRGTFRCRIAYWGRQPGEVTWEGGAQTMQPGQTHDIVMPDEAADGRTLSITINDGSLPADNSLAFRLPKRKPIRVAAIGVMPRALAAVVVAAPELTLVEDAADADVLIVAGPGDVPESTPTLAIVTDEDPPQKAAPLQGVEASALTGDLDFEGALCRSFAPMRTADGIEPLLTAGDAVVATLNTRDTVPSIRVEKSLMAADAAAPRRIAFAIFCTRALRHLAGWAPQAVTLTPEQSIAAHAAAHEPNTVPGSRIASNLTTASATDGSQPLALAGRNVDPWYALLLAALALVMTDALLHARGRIS